MSQKIVAVIPCFKVKDHILNVIERLGSEVSNIIVVDDCCPQASGRFVQEHCRDPRVHVCFNDVNLGVGGATMVGYRYAMTIGADICVKIDGDGQMDPAILPQIVAPIVNGAADYSKGNRFYFLTDVRGMPPARIFGNAALSFLTKLSSGYWSIFDPTNGYTAIHRIALERLDLDRIERRYFFESDILFRLYLLGAVVQDVPMRASYGSEMSNLKIPKIFIPFLVNNVRNFLKRIFYRYFLRDFNLASLELIFGLLSFGFGIIFGISHWISGVAHNEVASAGTVMLAALPVLAGLQLMLGFFAFDYSAIPRIPLLQILETKYPLVGANDMPQVTLTDEQR
jgi:dolichol-phosphate mannosyltransferase